MPRSILIVDDSETVRKAVRQFLQTLPGWEVSGEATDGVQAIEKARELRPDLILLDVSMPRLNGIAAASVLRKTMPRIHIILFTMFDDSVSSRLTTAAGVDLIVPKAEGLAGLVKSLQRLMGTSGNINSADQS